MKTRKELKDEYKQRSPPMGVFQIRNLTNGKIFVQRASDLSKIWESQKFKLENRGHTNEALQADWNTFGPDCFIFEILHELPPATEPSQDHRAELITLEEMCIEELQPYGDKGYLRKGR